MKIMVWSNPPWSPTGYGQQCAQLVMSFSELGHDVDVGMSYGMFGGSQPLPTGGQAFGMGYRPPYGEDRLPTLALNNNYDLILALANSWAMDAPLWAELKARAGCELWSYDPIERWAPVTEQVNWYEQTGAKMVAMTKHAAESARAAGIDVLTVAPHTLDEAYQPTKPDRKLFGLPEGVPIIGMIGANTGARQGWHRKGYDTAFVALRQLREIDTYKNAVMWIHAAVSDAQSGTDLAKMAHQAGLEADECLMFTPQQLQYQPLTPSGLAQAYACMDVFLNPSKAEGFGVPVVEAQACGVPVVATGNLGTSEVVRLGSLLRHNVPLYDTTQLGYVDVPSPDEVVEHLVRWLGKPPTAKQRAAKSKQVRALFNRERVRDSVWKPLLDGLPEATPNWSMVTG